MDRATAAHNAGSDVLPESVAGPHSDHTANLPLQGSAHRHHIVSPHSLSPSISPVKSRHAPEDANIDCVDSE